MTTTSPARAPGRPPKRRRTGRKLLIALIVLIGLLVAADFGAAAAAEYQVSKKARTQFGLADDPSVQIHGFPFTTQAIAGDYHDISISASGVPIENTLRDVQLNAELHDVRVPLSDLLSGTAKSVRVDSADITATVGATDIGRLLKLPDLTIDPAGPGEVAGDKKPKANEKWPKGTAGVRLSASENVAGLKTKLVAYAEVSLVSGKVRITPKRLDLSNSQLPKAAQGILAPLLSEFQVTLDPGQLPFTVTPTQVRVDPGSVVMSATAKNVVLSGNS